MIVIEKAVGRAVTWTGVGSIDKTFGLIFGFFKGYIVSVCIFSILNWFYPYKNWGISAEDAFTFKFISRGSEILIDEFPSGEDFIDTKEQMKKFNQDKLREECGIFGISNHEESSALVALFYMHYNTEDKKVVALFLLTVKTIIQKKDKV